MVKQKDGGIDCGTLIFNPNIGWHEGDALRWNALAGKSKIRQRVLFTADVFDNEVPQSWRNDLFGLIPETPHLDWLILTKHIGNAELGINDALGDNMLSPRDWPFQNAWLGITVCNQNEADRDIPKLLAIPAARRFLSIEPMLGAIDLYTWMPGARYYTARCCSCGWTGSSSLLLGGRPLADTGDFADLICPRCEVHEDFEDVNELDWVICGGESGKNARPMHPQWVRDLRDQCVDANVPFLFKQWGEWAPDQPRAGGDLGGDIRRGIVRHVCADRENDGYFKRGDVHMRRVGKKLAGRLLDGREWNEFPA